MWIDFTKVLSYNKTFNWILGNRGGGKTVEAQRLITSIFLKQDSTAIWLRRWDVELDKTFFDKFFTDPAFYLQFPDYEFKTNKSKYGGSGYLREKGSEHYKQYIQFMCLSTALKHKSIPFPSVKYIIFDEFIIDQKSNMRYLKNEVTVFLEFLQSVMRLRDDVRVIFIGNSISMINPYFLYYNIKRPKQEFTVGKEWVLYYYKNEEYTERLRQSKFGQLVSGTDYGDYAIENKFFRDSEVFIESKTKNSRYWFTIKYEDNFVSIWTDAKTGIYYLDTSYDVNRLCFALTTDDHNLSTIMINRAKEYFPLQSLVEAYKLGRVRVKNLKVQSIFLDILYLIS